jgi:hypothetical protein
VASRGVVALLSARRHANDPKTERALIEAQAQLAACHDLATLERWHDLAITAANAADVFG